ncbi:MAG: UDP-2,3-diacylglucosamine diphosphatase [Candidatus Berkiellales bacterium]
MTTIKPIYFISDLHLSVQDPKGLELFINFISGPAASAHQLYILGDLFDVWVGDDLNVEFQLQIQKALKALTSSPVEVFYMNGNRDFLLSTRFLQEAGCHRLTDPYRFILHGIPTLLTHGDRLCTKDIAYQRYRKIAQNPLTKWLFLYLPKKIREAISQKLRRKSQEYQKSQINDILDVTKDAVETWMIQYQVTQLIHGHVHRPKIHDLTIKGKKSKRLVLGDWHRTGSVMMSTPNDMTLATYDPQKGLNPQEYYALVDLIDLVG